MIRKFYLLLFISLTHLMGNANNPYIINLNKHEYSAANKNWNIREDEFGFIYVANDEGLLEFDGINWKLYKLPADTPVKSIFVENHNLIYTGNVESFGKWERDLSGNLIFTSLSNHLPESDLLHNEFWQTWKVNEAVYFQSFNYIYRFLDSKIEPVDNNNNPILFLFPVGDQLWVQKMKESLYSVDGLKLAPIPGTEKLRNTDVRVIQPLVANKILIGTSNHGLFIYENGNLQEWKSEISDKLKQKELNCAIIHTHNRLLFGTIVDGIYETDEKGNILNHFSIEKQLSNNTVLSLYQSKSGSVWIGYDRGLGIMHYWQNLSYFSLQKNDIGTIHDACIWNQKLFICSNQGVYWIPYSTFTKSQSLNGIKMIEGTQGQSWKLSVINNQLFSAHNRGIFQIHDNLSISTFSNIRNGVYDIQNQELFNKKHIIASTYNSAILVNEAQHYKYIGINYMPVKYTMTDHLNNIWLKVPFKGVYKFRLDNEFRTTDTVYIDRKHENGHEENINLMKIGNRIVLSADSLFYTYDELNNTIEPNTIINEAFKSIKNIKNIEPINEYNFWIVTSTAVYHLFYNGSIAKVVDQYYLGDYNLSLVERFERVSILNDSLSFIILDNGFLEYNTKKEVDKYRPQKTMILRISCFNKNDNVIHTPIYAHDSTLSVPASYNNLINIKVFAPNQFYLNENIEYTIKPIDDKWHRLSKSNTINFERLPSGKYTLEVKTTNNLGEQSDIRKIDLVIDKPFSQSFVAYLLYLVCFLILFYVIWILVLRRQRNIHLQKIRTRERNRLRQENLLLEEKVSQANAELFTRSNLILYKNRLLEQIREVLFSFMNGKDKKDPTVLSKKIMDILNVNDDIEDHWEMMLVKFEQNHPHFFNKIKHLAPDLSPSELRICVCLRLNFDSKEIAQMLNLSVRTVDNHRSKLRKKLNIPNNLHLIDFLLSI